MAWAPDYLTVAELRAYRNLAISDTADDIDLAVSITAASRAIDRHCNRQFGQVAAPELRYYTAWYDRETSRWIVDIDDLASTSGLVVEIADVGTVTSYKLSPLNDVAKGKVWTQLSIGRDSDVEPTGEYGEMEITAPWGWSAVPVSVKQASYIQGQRFSMRSDSPYGIAGSPENGSELRLLARLDPDVAVALSDFVRPRRPQ